MPACVDSTQNHVSGSNVSKLIQDSPCKLMALLIKNCQITIKDD